jgi:hypothetical protein
MDAYIDEANGVGNPRRAVKKRHFGRALSLDRGRPIDQIAAVQGADMTDQPKDQPKGGRRIIWLHVLTVVSAAILIGAEVFGLAFAGSWAIANLMGLGQIWAKILDVILFGIGILVMVQFVRYAQRIEPFTAKD